MMSRMVLRHWVVGFGGVVVVANVAFADCYSAGISSIVLLGVIWSNPPITVSDPVIVHAMIRVDSLIRRGGDA